MDTATITNDALISTLADDPDLIEIVELFVDEMTGRTAQLSSFFGGEDWEGLRRSAHQLKGAAGSYGFHPISAAAAQLEDVVRAEEPEEIIRQELEAVIDLCNRASAGTRQLPLARLI